MMEMMKRRKRRARKARITIQRKMSMKTLMIKSA
jgi:hypothetical protein